MFLNYLWIFFFLIAFVVALGKLLFLGDTTVFPNLINSTFNTAKQGFEIALGLTGVLTFWLGIMRIGEKAGIVQAFSKFMGPLLQKLFLELPKNHPAVGSMLMNFSMNMIGLDNAAIPLGLKIMKQLQEINPQKDTPSKAQIMFVVLNTSGLMIIPISIMAYRAQLGAIDPTDVFIPIVLATFCSTLAGLIAVAIYQKINLFDKTIVRYLGTFILLMGSCMAYLYHQPQAKLQQISSVASNFILFSLIIAFILLAIIKKVNVYEAFIAGAKEGFQIAIFFIPYLVAILIAVGVFRACGAMDFLISGIHFVFKSMGLNTDFIPALPTALMKPITGSGARAMMIDTMKTYGPDSLVGRIACIMQGATETTLYMVAVYFGAINIRKTRYAITCGLIADFMGIIIAIFMGYLFFN